ncbi:MAG: PH domain-containing protein [Elusimicrobia bacterium]|nr:PH domain-containing protein [Elusimicrobiota bacterium]
MKLLVAAPSIKNWPLSLAGGAFLVLAGAAGFSLQAFGASAAFMTIVAGAVVALYPALRAASTEYLVTNSRVFVRSGILVKAEASIALASVRELRLKRSPVQRALGLGDIEVAGDGESVLLFGLDDPEQTRDRILSLAA